MLMLPTAQGLPPDILRELFEHLAIVDPAGWCIRSHAYSMGLGWITATHVCRRWREIGSDMTTLWAYSVCAFPNISVADELLRRARNCLLNIQVSHFVHRSSLGQHRPHLPISWGAQQLHRAHTFDCHIYRWSTFADDHPGAYAALTDPLPDLQHITLISSYLDKLHPFPTVVLRAPALISANLRGILLHPTSIASKLRKLSLTSGSEGAGADLSPVLDSLRSLKCLEHLNMTFDTHGTMPVANCSVVHLEHLRTLHALCSTVQQASDVLEFISAPHIRWLSVTISSILSNEQIFAKAGVHWQQLQKSPNSRCTLSVSKSHLYLHDEIPELTALELSWHAPNGLLWVNYTSIVSALPRVLDFSRFICLELSCSKDGHQCDELDAALAVFRDASTRVEVLTLYNTPHPSTLRMLLASDGDSPLPVPALKTLCFGAEHWEHGQSGRSRLVHGGGTATMWWDTVKDVLGIRSQKGAPINRLFLAGDWCTQEAWTEEWTTQSEECLTRGLVSEVVDIRERISECDLCDS
ncbi:hypothetical protein PENSPDRAFT_351787 [Peniophora sp. CONT]|nr:hypothetical protein PENSPDRAFT_351787 [Peniophora sp. CONT]